MSSRSIVFMGTPDFACPTLQTLIDRGERLLAVVTQPDRPKGRGHKLMPPPVKELALAHDIPVLQPHRVRASAFVDSIRQLAPELIVVVAFGQILPKALLDIPPRGCVNVHASLLPRYRGAAPLNWCIINGETETGVTTMLMDTGLDTGPMLLKRATPIDENEDIVSLHDRMASLGAELLAETLDGLREGRIEPQAQDDSLSCYAPLLKKEHGLIDWQRPARQIHNQVRGLAAWPGAQTLLNGQALKLFYYSMGWNSNGTPTASSRPNSASSCPISTGGWTAFRPIGCISGWPTGCGWGGSCWWGMPPISPIRPAGWA